MQGRRATQRQRASLATSNYPGNEPSISEESEGEPDDEPLVPARLARGSVRGPYTGASARTSRRVSKEVVDMLRKYPESVQVQGTCSA